ncbi:ATP-binding protein [Solirubrobacter soli]|uniref:ATP-binding protein n=1 Tax=Solirubrobacter soli TaxID=363832 RepID=UPI00041AF31D|nr:BTAD domain-containing putative transcriptional regulator [Solirubrobacter soli]
MTLAFGLLGPVSAWRNGVELALGSPQQRALLALLLLHRNEVVSTARMLDVLWPARAPANALQVLRTYVFRLRAEPLGPAEDSPLLTRRQGYELQVGGHAVDADRFEALLAAGRAAFEGGKPATAEALLREALELFRGTPFAELDEDDLARIERGRLEELRAVAAEELVEARLALGRHRELVSELRAAVAADRRRERTCGQLMVALYRSGRQTEALEAYHTAHRALADEYGLAPGPQLRGLERMILLQDRALDLPAPRAPALPRYETSFLGRGDELTALRELLRGERLVSLVGAAGVGKTRLAAETAAGIGDARVWWVDLGSIAAGRVVAAVARSLAVPEVPGRAAADLVVARLREARSLLVLDNCEHAVPEVAGLAAHVLDRDPDVRILSTSRESLRVAGERVQPLAGLRPPVAERLFAERSTVAVEPDDLRELVGCLDGLPLAIELAAAALRSTAPADLAAALRERLTMPGDEQRLTPRRQRTLEAAIGWSYDLLPPEQQDVLRRLAVFPGSFAAEQAHAVVGDIGALLDASLVTAESGRYRLLQTVRAFALARLHESGDHEDAARRHRDVYQELAEVVELQMLGPGLPEWLPRSRLEHENFDAALRWSLDTGDSEGALRFAATMGWYWYRTGFVAHGRELIERALALSGPHSPWWPHALVTRSWMATGAATADAVAITDEAVAVCERVGGDDLGQALANSAQALIAAGRLDDARVAIERSRAIFSTIPRLEEGVIFADQCLGCLLLERGELDEAEALLVRAHDAMRRMRGTRYAGFTLIELARVQLAQRRPDAAAETAAHALADLRRREDSRGIAGALTCLGRARAALGESDQARAHLEEAVAIAERWGFANWAREAERALATEVDVAGQEPAL